MKDLGFLTSNPYAHRGLHTEKTPENSMGAIKNALAAGYNIEIDVQITSDGKVIVMHDRRLGRLLNGRGRIKRLTYKEISSLNILDSEEKVPLLSDVLEEIAGKAALLIEIKSARVDRKIEEKVYGVLKGYKGEFGVMSFNPLSMKWFDMKAPQIPTGQLVTWVKYPGVNFQKSMLFYRGICNTIVKTDFTCYNINSLPNLAARRERSLGKPVLTWTVKTEKNRGKAAGVADNLIFELPVKP